MDVRGLILRTGCLFPLWTPGTESDFQVCAVNTFTNLAISPAPLILFPHSFVAIVKFHRY